MSKPLDGVRIAITENRYPEQLAQLLQRQGATVIACPLLRETPVEDAGNARLFMERCETVGADYIVFYTGVGVEFLFRAEPKPGILERSKIVARGPKVVNALKKFGLHHAITAEAPTTSGILQTLSREDLQGKSVLVQLYGQEGQPQLRDGLEAMGATATGISLYQYEAASDVDALSEFVGRVMRSEIDVITFTNGPQAQFLLKFAGTQGNGAAFLDQLRERVVVASIGEVTARAVGELGIRSQIVPDEPKMGPLVRAIADFFEKRKQGCSTLSS